MPFQAADFKTPPINFDNRLRLHPPKQGFACHQVVEADGGSVRCETKGARHQPVLQPEFVAGGVGLDARPVWGGVQQPVGLLRLGGARADEDEHEFHARTCRLVRRRQPRASWR